MDIKSKEEILLDSLTKFFYNNEIFNEVINIITGKSHISLRIIDHFTTNYANKYNVVYQIKKKNQILNFNVFNSYKNQLKAFNKRCFDPFCRVNKNNYLKRIIFKYDENQFIETTIGQINFFKWALEYNIINYIQDNYNKIYDDMTLKKNFKLNNKKMYFYNNNINNNISNYSFCLKL